MEEEEEVMEYEDILIQVLIVVLDQVAVSGCFG